MLASTLTAAAAALGAMLAGPLGPYRLPDPAPLAQARPAQATRVFLQDGSLLAEPAAERRVAVPLEAMPRLLPLAFLAAEDRGFREHGGLDFVALARAASTTALSAATGGGRREGGSTITQQLVKNTLLSSDRTLDRKIREAFTTLRLERAMSKDGILEAYLNRIYLGLGAHGVTAAAATYFGKPLDQLTLGEMAYLAGLPKAPNRYHPERQRERALARRAYVLQRMVEDGAITAAEAAEAGAEPIVLAKGADAPMAAAPPGYFGEEVRRLLVKAYGEDAINRGLHVVATMDPRVQAAAERALRDGLMEYDRRRGWRGALATLPADLLDGRSEAPTLPIGAPVAAPAAGGLRQALAGLVGGIAGAAEAKQVEAPPRRKEPWEDALAAVPRPSGAEGWTLAVVLSVSERRADLGLPGGGHGSMAYEEVRWARRSMPGQRVGPTPSRVPAVLARGDVVLVERVGQDKDGLPALALRQVPAVQGGLVAIEVRTGRVLAMAGGFSFDGSRYNRATQAMRQPGSSFKPIIYLTALELGYSPSSEILDAPIQMRDGTSVWDPENYGGGASGMQSLRWGLEHSRNLMTVRLMDEIGIEAVARTAERLGVYDQMPRYPSVALGSAETTPLRITAAYAMIANGGRRVVPTVIDRVQDASGKVLYAHGAPCPECAAPWRDQGAPKAVAAGERVIGEAAAAQMVSMLRGVVTRGTAASALGKLGLPLAGKTGTTNDSKDVWFVGFSPEIAAGVFVGFDDPRTLGPGETGGSIAAPIFGRFMTEALKAREPSAATLPGWAEEIERRPTEVAPEVAGDGTPSFGGKTLAAFPPSGPAVQRGAGAPGRGAGGFPGPGGLY